MEAAPQWCTRLRVLRSAREQIPVDVSQLGALRAAVLEMATKRGSTYQALVERGGPGDERVFGSAEVRGASPELIVVVSVDERVVSSIGQATVLNNTVSLQVRRPKVAGRKGTDWSFEVFQALCDRLSPAWGWAGHPGEYWAKVMTEEPSIRAVGRDLGRYLPGVFWLNFFGRPYRQLIRDDRLQSAPASNVVMVDQGVLIGLGLKPTDWDTAEYATAEQRVRDHLGAQSVLLQGRAGAAHDGAPVGQVSQPWWGYEATRVPGWYCRWWLSAGLVACSPETDPGQADKSAKHRPDGPLPSAPINRV